MAKVQYFGTGRRKNSTARVILTPGTGAVEINGRDMADYLNYDHHHIIVKQPFVTTDTAGSYDVKVNVKGGGFTGQAGCDSSRYCTCTINC